MNISEYKAIQNELIECILEYCAQPSVPHKLEGVGSLQESDKIFFHKVYEKMVAHLRSFDIGAHVLSQKNVFELEEQMAFVQNKVGIVGMLEPVMCYFDNPILLLNKESLPTDVDFAPDTWLNLCPFYMLLTMANIITRAEAEELADIYRNLLKAFCHNGRAMKIILANNEIISMNAYELIMLEKNINQYAVTGHRFIGKQMSKEDKDKQQARVKLAKTLFLGNLDVVDEFIQECYGLKAQGIMNKFHAYVKEKKAKEYEKNEKTIMYDCLTTLGLITVGKKTFNNIVEFKKDK